MASDRKTIRVNLRFGPRTDVALWREIHGRRPYDRAKFVRGLIRQGWRLVLDETHLGSPHRAVAPRAEVLGPAPPQLADTARAEDEFGDGVLSLVGRTVRL